MYCCSVDMSMCANLCLQNRRQIRKSGASSFNHWPRPLPRPLVTQPLGRTGWSNSGRSHQTPPSPRPPGIRHLLSGAWETVSTVVHSEVQGDSGRGTTETVSSRVPQCLCSWRNTQKVRPSYHAFITFY